MDSTPAATIAARSADLREMLEHDLDEYEGITKDQAVEELLDALDHADDDEVIRIIFTDEDVKGIAADNDLPFDEALERAHEWGKHIADTATGLCSEQLESVILTGNP